MDVYFIRSGCLCESFMSYIDNQQNLIPVYGLLGKTREREKGRERKRERETRQPKDWVKGERGERATESENGFNSVQFSSIHLYCHMSNQIKMHMA